MNSIRELFFAMTEYQGNTFYSDVISFWSNKQNYHRYLQHIVENIIEPEDALYITDAANWELYALSRVLDILTCSLQHSSHYPHISLDEYIAFAQSIGLSCEQPKEFHPFFYEITDVKVGTDPFLLHAVHYPALFLGNLLINRGGATITLPDEQYPIQEIKTAPIYWAYTRNNREAHDLSHGWGHNSQWRTSFRFDFRTEKGLFYNFTGKDSLNHPDQQLLTKLHEDNISLDEAIDLVRYRQLLYIHKKDELWPYDYRFFEPDTKILV